MVEYPKKVYLMESLPRDGFQNVKTFIPTEHKIEIIKKLIDAGFKDLEVTSFVSPKAVPQMADAAEVAKAALEYAKGKGVLLRAFTPNHRGVENALSAGITHVSSGISASDRHCLENWRCSFDELLNRCKELKDEFVGQAQFEFGIACAFSDPFGGSIAPERIQMLCDWAFGEGFETIGLCDTTGNASPRFVREILEMVVSRYGSEKFSMHVHDTYGFGLANYLTGLELGINKFSNVVGGLGGCPFAPGAAGNQATEDLILMCQGMGIEVDIDMDKVYEVLALIEAYVNEPISSHAWSVKKNTPCFEQ